MPERGTPGAIEIAPPDIRPYAAGNTGVPYVHTFRARASGPHVLVTAIVHGNELCGAVALDHFLRSGLRPRRGTLSLAFCNVDAYQRFDAAQPTRSRFVDEDFNRIWADDILDGGQDSTEKRRARVLRPIVAEADLLLDIHSMQSEAAPLTLSGPLARGRELARAITLPKAVFTDPGHAAGPRMRDYRGFTDPASARNALLVECGQHWKADTAVTAVQVLYAFLGAAGTLNADDIAPFVPAAPPRQNFFEVTDVVTVRTDRFRFLMPLSTHDVIPKAGTPIATDGDATVVTPHDDCVVVMPSLWPIMGATAVRLARRIG